MSVATVNPMGRKAGHNQEPTKSPRDRIDLRAEPDLVARIKAQADRLGISLSAYIRIAVVERIERDEVRRQ